QITNQLDLSKILPTDLAYTAGIIDGEGSIDIAPDKGGRRQPRRLPVFVLRVHVASTDRVLLEYLTSIFHCGTIRRYEKKPPRKPTYTWSLRGNSALSLLRQVLPYLIIKARQARIAIKFQESKRDCDKAEQARLSALLRSLHQ